MSAFQHFFNKTPLYIKNSAVIASVILLIICALLLKENQYLHKINENNLTLMKQQISTITQNKKDLEDLYYLKNDLAKMKSQFRREYKFGEVGIYSQEFSDKQIDFYLWDYKSATISEKIINLGNTSDHGVVVWELGGNYYNTGFPSLTGYDSSKRIQYDFPTFGGYENHGSPIYISSLLQQAKTSFVNNYGIKMYLGYDYAPKQISGVTASFFLPSNSAIGIPERYIILMQSVKGYPVATDQGIQEATNKLKQFANTITLTNPNK